MFSQLESENMMFVSLAPTTRPDQCGFRDGKKDFLKEKNGDGVMEGQPNQAVLISFLLCFLAFFSLFLPCTKELCAQLSALPLFCV